MITKMGKYLCTYCPGHHRATKEGYVYTHILVAEKKIGRLLKDEEVVHHIDEDKYNNSEDNLIVFKTKRDHTSFHKGCKIHQEGDVWVAEICFSKICPICSKLKDYKANICLDCYRKCQRTGRPSKDKLCELIHTIPFTKIGEMFEVSDNTIRKWCKSYGLPFNKKDIEESALIKY